MSDSFDGSSKWLFRTLIWTAFLLVLFVVLYKAVFRKQATELGNCLDRASHSEQYKTRHEAVEGYARCVAKNEKGPPVTNPRCPYAGTWSSQRNGVEYFVTLNSDGTFLAEPGRNTQPGERPIGGAWTVANKKFVWAYDAGPVWPPDINPMFNEADKKFSLREVDGAVTQFLQMSKEEGGQC